MRKKLHIWITSLICTGILISGIWFFGGFEQEASKPDLKEVELSAVEMKKARKEYFFRMLRDPAKNKIPNNIRSRELDHAKQLPSRGQGFLSKSGKSSQAVDISWQLAGPTELGGRTRALAIERYPSPNPDIILAGGVSGGIWKSTDGGNTWELKTDPNQNMSVSSIAQDPTNPDTWYYASGEINGSAGASGAPYYGRGIYKSTDNGDSWSLMSQASSDTYQFVDEFNTVSRIRVSPTSGTIFISSNGNGIYRSTDGQTFSSNPVLGMEDEPLYSDVTVASDGTVAAVISDASFSDQSSTTPGASHNPGIFISTSADDGQSGTWIEVTPNTFPDTHRRSVLAFAPSNPDILYVFTLKGANNTSNQGVSFHKIDISDPNNPSSDNRSSNLPDFGGDVGGVNLQGGYNMVVSVKPDDPDFVMIGGTNLFRSRDGFATVPSGGYDNSNSSQKDEYWIGGYAKANNISQYPQQHPDQHVITYVPNSPDKVWAGHDGGLSITDDITASNGVTWQDKDDGYVTGQFYTVDIGPESGDKRIMGGTQDNGSPYFTIDDQNMQQTAFSDVSSGDGAYSHIGNNYIYSSSQLGRVLRWNESFSELSYVEPLNAQNQLFIHPYSVDPNDDGIMYYPGGTTMWRNTKVDEIPGNNPDGTTEGWDDLSAVSSGYTISALGVTKSQPSDRLYYAAYSGSQSPKLFSVDNASSSWTPDDISISGAPTGAYVHDIAINPHDGDELIAVMSNYGIEGLYHSTDAGQNWTLIEGNLHDSSNPGPSLRSATILPTSSETIYLVGTSTGVYSTTTLDGSSTTWARESDDGSTGSIGYSVSESIESRPLDGKIAVGTHGRGIFVGQTNVAGVQPKVVNVNLDIGNTWQLVGSPMSSASDVSLGDDLTMFGFSGTYKSSSSMEPHTGYWVKSRSGSQINYNGDEDTTATIGLQEGWNLIGGITDTVSVSNINDPSGIRSSTPVQEYVGGSYQDATEIKSTHGYWIHANQSGNIEITNGSSSGKNSLATSSAFKKIEFSRGSASQLFYVSSQSVEEDSRNQFRMPPKAPQPILDVRTPEGFRLAEGKSTELELTTTGYPVTVSSAQRISSSLVLKGVTGKDTVYYDLNNEREVSIQRPHEKLLLEPISARNQITEHNLLPNYPNPFNPSTQIRYEVASQTGVLVEIYDVLGRKVRTLVNKQQPRGSYTVQFDGSNLSSGAYFIHLKAGSKAKVQKMTLIK